MNDEVSELLKKAEQGDADAELRLGSAYCSGDGVEKSSSEAEKWWQRAAAHGSAGAARCLESLHQASHKSGESGAQNEDSQPATDSGSDLFTLLQVFAIIASPFCGLAIGLLTDSLGWTENGVKIFTILGIISAAVRLVFLVFSRAR